MKITDDDLPPLRDSLHFRREKVSNSGYVLRPAYSISELREAQRQAYAKGIADFLKMHEGKTFAWLVCSVNKDGSLSLEYAAPWQEAAHEHINDAVAEDIEGAAQWVVRPAFLAPQPQEASPEELAKRGWQAIECPICGGGAQSFPQPKAIEAAVMAEREACAQACQNFSPFTHPASIADAIRARTTSPETRE